MPQFPGFRNLTVRFYSQKGSHFRAIATGLLQRCSNLRYLHLDVHLHLREVEFSSFSGQGYCFDIVQLLLIGAPALERMILTMQASEEGCKRPTIDLASLKSRLPHGMGNLDHSPSC
ncbi:hypothetical protein ZWY2020_040820 [Hordeum vulgare]|nr:hypothetical protein ZWY2020_040820 [Hordeum vulgare]